MKRTDFNPTATWESEKGDPGTHLVMAVFGCVIYELNKCADAFSEANVIACAKMAKICSSYAEKKDDFRSSLQALPLKTVLEEAKRLEQYQEDKRATSETAEACKSSVTTMKTAHDLCAVVVNLVTNAKSTRQDTAASMRSQAILTALEQFDWAKNDLGKIIFLTFPY